MLSLAEILHLAAFMLSKPQDLHQLLMLQNIDWPVSHRMAGLLRLARTSVEMERAQGCRCRCG